MQRLTRQVVPDGPSMEELFEAEPEEERSRRRMGRKKKKAVNRLTVGELKQLVRRPDVVEVSAPPSNSKSAVVGRHSARSAHADSPQGVPQHNRRPTPLEQQAPLLARQARHRKGCISAARLVHSSSDLTVLDFIEATGIAAMRNAMREKDDGKSAKSKAKERMQPRMNRLDIDYQVLHDAFFKYQTKPKMTRHGDMYYEGKEFEVNVKEKKPGLVSDDLKVTCLSKPCLTHAARPRHARRKRFVSPVVAPQHATLRPPARISKPQNPWGKCAPSTWRAVRLPPWGLGQASR
jgi:splicing factor 3B subunit 2